MRQTLLTLLDAAGPDGYADITISKNYIFRELPANKTDALRKLLTTYFYNYPLLSLKFEQVKGWVKTVEAKGAADDQGNWTIRVNMARLFYLPCENPQAELKQLRALFEAMKPFFEANAHRRADIQICNNRDHNKRVYGAMTCRVEESADRMGKDETFTEALKSQIDASPALQYFLRSVALGLQKMGPWSWTILDEDHLFGRNAGPWSVAFIENYRANENKLPEVKVAAPVKAKPHQSARAAKRKSLSR